MSKPKGSKYALFPNLWEFLNLIATVLGLGTKATVWGNNKTFYESGFLPIESQSGDVNAVDILKHIVDVAQKKANSIGFAKTLGGAFGDLGMKSRAHLMSNWRKLAFMIMLGG